MTKKEIIRILEQRLEEMNNRLVEVENTRTLFISNMLNEINNPLTSILGLTQQLLKVQNPDWNQVTETISWVNEEAMFLEFQLRNIFAAAELEQGTMEIEPTNILINDLWSKLSTPYLNVIHHKKLKILTNDQFLLPPSISGQLLFQSDAQMVRLLMINLFDNAVKVAPDNSTIKVTFSYENNELSFSVEDEGCGIPEQNQSAIFDRFRQLDQSTTKQIRGVGLGLSLVLAVCDMLKGRIELYSTVGEGSTFKFVIPESAEGLHTDSSLDNFLHSAPMK
jgi:two-component system, OmpR family, phosphate regulon sensor histidine kinase PhoR